VEHVKDDTHTQTLALTRLERTKVQ